jgi:hypothetical protein
MQQLSRAHEFRHEEGDDRAIESPWKATRSKPGGSAHSKAATLASASLQGATNAKWPAPETARNSGAMGNIVRRTSVFHCGGVILSSEALQSCSGMDTWPSPSFLER